MASSNGSVLPQRPRHDYTWGDRFSVRQLLFYDAEDTRITNMPTRDPPEDLVTSFLGFCASHLDPLCFNFEALENFLRLAEPNNLIEATSATSLIRLALVDDRRDPTGIEGVDQDLDGWSTADLAREGLLKIGDNRVRKFNGQRRDWKSEKYARQPPRGDFVRREVLDEQSLYTRLSIKVCFWPHYMEL